MKLFEFIYNKALKNKDTGTINANYFVVHFFQLLELQHQLKIN